VISIPPERKEVARPVIPNILRKTKIATLNQSFVSKAFGFRREKSCQQEYNTFLASVNFVSKQLLLPFNVHYQCNKNFSGSYCRTPKYQAQSADIQDN
jgi:hypothetical protein